MTCKGDHHWMEINTTEGWFRQCINENCFESEERINNDWVKTDKQWLP